ncbi:hypothetical protein ACFL4T_08970 [candidate division KSB1 bacterium]
MATRINYYISAAKFNQDRTKAEKLNVRILWNGFDYIWDRVEVIECINKGYNFFLFHENDDKLTVGEKVRVTEIEGKTFLRIDKKNVHNDFLGEISEIEYL